MGTYMFCPKCGQYQKIKTNKHTTISDGESIEIFYHTDCWLCDNDMFMETVKAPIECEGA